ncbi:hypothetical protein Nmel_013818 [Mimus melanotis]
MNVKGRGNTCTGLQGQLSWPKSLRRKKSNSCYNRALEKVLQKRRPRKKGPRV